MALFSFCAAQLEHEKSLSDDSSSNSNTLQIGSLIYKASDSTSLYKKKTTGSYFVHCFFFFFPTYKHKTLGKAEVKVLIATLTLSSGVYYI